MIQIAKHVLAGLTMLAVIGDAGSSALAETTTFDFDDPKQVNGVVFVVDSKLEPITGMIGGVGGIVDYDPAEPTSLSGSITIDLAEVSLINPKMTKHLKGDEWLNISDAFVATMMFDKVTSFTEKDGGGTMLEVEATLAFGGKQLPMTVMIDATHLPDAANERGMAESGDLLILRSMFNLSRLDLGIKPDMPTDNVGEKITVMVPIVGYSK